MTEYGLPEPAKLDIEKLTGVSVVDMTGFEFGIPCDERKDSGHNATHLAKIECPACKYFEEVNLCWEFICFVLRSEAYTTCTECSVHGLAKDYMNVLGKIGTGK